GEFSGADIYHTVICDALLATQVSVVCIWAVLGTNRVLWVPVLIAVFVAGLAGAVCQDSSETFISRWHLYVSLYGLEAALLVFALWVFRDLYWRRHVETRRWRFSLGQLLLVMTTAAVMTTTMRTGPFADESKWANVGFAVCVVVLSLVSAVVWSFTWHWLLRLAATLAAAIVVGLACCTISDFGTPAFLV